ncbi:MAG: 3-deoxy-D-manno-octulosonic acid transferase [Rhodospirillaceae bacterium]|jgi:3-deoxy-D-manno-octulosonic-acid transferase|nr:3-deoxy-D-manno-octulosonic acid transferase [Rhodospirillaceae bacterium]MBT5244074.1 3-deoxy-D-manno-octulosonic acid transferase [Rhodospirillaceae bacterium]MBT5560894.1 3-deoxy-D-manno-octulosonic acid transferase [Rhodospirillaceae bacterium]MBT6241183.1 3-deoxy-D-manno-octulosonic acid transferase [Rhodospirillaceae bacterium]MBT7136286.1 3-deoxy-D-manno-octulosonic acid transferase [Rhodospirillaceae bacterium]
MILSIYRIVTTLGQPLIRFHLSRRLAKGKEDKTRFGERLGVAGKPRPDGKLVWIHAASVGESLSLLPLIERLRTDYADWNILLTTGTVTSAALMAERLPEGTIHQYVPVDRAAYGERFLNHWRPDLALWAESEFWPNLICRAAAKDLPMILLNGRISNKSYSGWRRFPGLIRKLLGAFSLCLGQSNIDAARLSDLGATNAKSVGNLKFAAPPLPADALAIDIFTAQIDGRPCWLASSTHKGEEEIVGRVQLSLKEKHPALLSIIVPRHPGRGIEVSAGLQSMGLNTALRSAGEKITADTDIYIADTMGELGLFYRLSPIVFIGKSLIASGGQNPLEAARLGCAIIFGPHMSNFAEITDTFMQNQAGLEIADEAGMRDTIDHLLSHPDECLKLGQAAARVADNEADVLDAVMGELIPYLKGGN